MLQKEKIETYSICSNKTSKDKGKIVRGENRNKEKTQQKIVTNMINMSPTISIITLIMNDLSTPIKRQSVRGNKKNKTKICYLKETQF